MKHFVFFRYFGSFSFYKSLVRVLKLLFEVVQLCGISRRYLRLSRSYPRDQEIILVIRKFFFVIFVLQVVTSCFEAAFLSCEVIWDFKPMFQEIILVIKELFEFSGNSLGFSRVFMHLLIT